MIFYFINVHFVFRDEDITTNDKNVNKNVGTLRPNNPDGPATSSEDTLTVNVTFPDFGVPVDKVRFPDRENIDAVKVYYYEPESNKRKPLNSNQVRHEIDTRLDLN